jgi:hypothetical protein
MERGVGKIALCIVRQAERAAFAKLVICQIFSTDERENLRGLKTIMWNRKKL